MRGGEVEDVIEGEVEVGEVGVCTVAHTRRVGGMSLLSMGVREGAFPKERKETREDAVLI